MVRLSLVTFGEDKYTRTIKVRRCGLSSSMKMKYHNVHDKSLEIWLTYLDPGGYTRPNSAIEYGKVKKGVDALIKYGINVSNLVVTKESNKCISKHPMLSPTMHP